MNGSARMNWFITVSYTHLDVYKRQQYMRQGFFPDMVYDQLYMEYKLPEGNNYTRVVRDLSLIHI